jgi:RNase P subunit RPR2
MSVLHLRSKLQPLRTACRTPLEVKGKMTHVTITKANVTCKKCKDTDEYKYFA